MGDIRDFKRPVRSGKRREARPNQWLGHPEMQDFIANVAFNTQADMAEACVHSAAVRLGEDKVTEIIEHLVHALWQATDQMGISIAQAVVGADSLRAELMRHLIEQVAYTAATTRPATALANLCPIANEDMVAEFDVSHRMTPDPNE